MGMIRPTMQEIQISDKSRAFLEKYLPHVFKLREVDDVLLDLDAFITANGLDMDDEITPFGREGEAVYDNILYSYLEKKADKIAEAAKSGGENGAPLDPAYLIWMENPKWYKILETEDENGEESFDFKLTDKAPPEAVESFKRYQEKKAYAQEHGIIY